MQTSHTPQKQFLKDYLPPTYDIEQVELNFSITYAHEKNADICTVTAKSKFVRKHPAHELFLNGENLKLVDIKLNGNKPNYKLDDHGITLIDPPAEFELLIVTELFPAENTSLEGLYQSNNIFCTQCEAQGFRKITYFLDRPDVMSKFRVEIEADQKKYPILLSNGNRIEQQTLTNGRHRVIWDDPFKKPCYLFALVAGDLGLIQDQYTTASGNKVALEIYSAHGKQARCHHAMESLKKSMRWDEVRFGREYDLSVYIIVAIDDFNAGAMENKGLNIFNSRLVLADPATATDLDYYNIESVVAHEYFHNWTGNRVTLRDWFHLSLKEGLTVFRDQEFSMDQYDRSLIRIDNVNDLRSAQFAEDAGPNAHPIRPASCYSVDNFFTSTIYEKGSEVIRMMQTMVGRPGFRLGMDLYFQRHDGQAVIIEDFAKAIADANKQNWEQFKLWYSQAGTPIVDVQESYDPNKKQYTLKLKQSCPLTSQEQKQQETEKDFIKKAFHIPLLFALLDTASGQELKLTSEHNQDFTINTENQYLLHLKQAEQEFVFNNISNKPIVSINRQFSAPIHLSRELNLDQQLFLMKYDSDAFNRWEACQNIYLQLWINNLGNKDIRVDEPIARAFTQILDDSSLNEGLKAKLIEWPSMSYLSQKIPTIDGASILAAKKEILTQLARFSEASLIKIYQQFHGKNTNELSPIEINRRTLKNTCLHLLSYLPLHENLLIQQLEQAKQMTDQEEALSGLVDLASDIGEKGIDLFYNRWKNESLVLNKWFAAQALSTNAKTFERVKALMSHPDFNIKNPNRVYSVLLRFGSNISQFHQNKAEIYQWMAEQIYQIDQLNPQVAARVSGCFNLWKKLTPHMQSQVQKILQDLLSKGLSSNTHEIISKALEAGNTN